MKAGDPAVVDEEMKEASPQKEAQNCHCTKTGLTSSGVLPASNVGWHVAVAHILIVCLVRPHIHQIKPGARVVSMELNQHAVLVWHEAASATDEEINFNEGSNNARGLSTSLSVS